jgi:hypothetical protein
MKMTLEEMLKLRTELPGADAGPIELTEDEAKQLQAPCQCKPNGNEHQYDCPMMKLLLRALVQRGTKQDRENFVKNFRRDLSYASGTEEERQIKQLCADIGVDLDDCK